MKSDETIYKEVAELQKLIEFLEVLGFKHNHLTKEQCLDLISDIKSDLRACDLFD